MWVFAVHIKNKILLRRKWKLLYIQIVPAGVLKQESVELKHEQGISLSSSLVNTAPPLVREVNVWFFPQGQFKMHCKRKVGLQPRLNDQTVGLLEGGSDL